MQALGALPNPTGAWCSPANHISYCSVFLQDYGTAELHCAKDLSKTAAVEEEQLLPLTFNPLSQANCAKGDMYVGS